MPPVVPEPPRREPFDGIFREGVDDERNLARTEKSPDVQKVVPPVKGDIYLKDNLGVGSISTEQLNQEIRWALR